MIAAEPISILLQAGRPSGSVAFELVHPDLDAVTARCEPLGITTPVERVLRVCGVELGQRHVTLVDPDGNLVRLIDDRGHPSAIDTLDIRSTLQ